MAGLTATIGLTVPAGPAQADPHGPDPTEASVSASRGTYEFAQVSVAAGSGRGFNRGTIYYPTTTAEGRFGAVAVIPGFSSPQSAIQWFGPMLASKGFVVFTLDTLNPLNFPTSRSQQLLAALDYLGTQSPVRDRVDSGRLAVMGHSMGGGGSLWAAQNRPSLKAAIPLAPWELDNTWQGVRVPTMIVGGESDTVAPVGSMSIPSYTSINAAPEKAYLEFRNGSHATPIVQSPTLNKYVTSWLKRFVDDDTRYAQFLCPTPAPDTTISQYRGTCPVG
ncbi:alpha/beta hydrolase [Actinomadura fulvescens]|uniref:dienelactone hydrolase family protein n=1 Tax=Actinomadura fulvescens TaxID=46160 RepID=UPI0031D961DB